MGKVAVVAVGGNSLIKDKAHSSVPDQYMCVVETVKHIADMIDRGWNVVISHGNGPQVGFMLLRSEAGIKEGLHPIPMDSCGADTQGSIGYNFQQALSNEFRRRGIKREVATVVTRVLVDKEDPAFQNPSKPVGPFLTKEDAEARKEKEGWDIVEDAGRGWRRVVPSPLPKEILEENAIATLVKGGFIVVAVGGGGIPVYYDKAKNIIKGCAAVIDKDFASALLASNIKADLLLISTAVEKVCINFGKPDQKQLDRITVSEAKKYMAEGHFAKGSMLPKIQAVIKFFENGGKEALITCPEKIGEAMDGKTGTWIVKD
ncbi:MAG: carbamate kinase [Candidatus Omnitrophota bacterium]|nr:carbamate kinase [Candidatus Omnitrophota bacterium]MBU2528772.1 carbamate kinase [bacterium]MBU3929113.1 carbamate kinase [bacterium]MBU4123182.1 carbamate kinase [bacterium]